MLSDLAAPRDISAGHCENHYTTIHNQLLTLTYRLDKSYESWNGKLFSNILNIKFSSLLQPLGSRVATQLFVLGAQDTAMGTYTVLTNQCHSTACLKKAIVCLIV